ncbi:hypothetical protein DGMP_37440 [Desulfomarina profundi]|uniref:HNH nuclease domain-containing protein n=1 Tax=Desulfomarina profundi TaxID=2772557 RepID=A0A8D5JTD3_9BACT|nr:HNH endonuclease [Desulfomarina profundi]BCL63051.1 hypothetical protein DGMP_37440 [Desulfomarina profundi]
MSTWRDDIIKALETIGGVAPLSEIYAAVKKIRPEPHPQSIKAIIRGTIEDSSSDSEKFKGNDIFFSAKGLGNGVWGLRSLINSTPKPTDIELPEGNDSPEKMKQETYRILRDTNLARQIKLLHKNKCQLCGEYIEINNEQSYSEAHHIMPLGKPHNGPDVAGNIIVLCPNHHVMLDYGVIELNANKIKTVPGHIIEDKYVEYHNHKIWQKAANK